MFLRIIASIVATSLSYLFLGWLDFYILKTEVSTSSVMIAIVVGLIIFAYKEE